MYELLKWSWEMSENSTEKNHIKRLKARLKKTFLSPKIATLLTLASAGHPNMSGNLPSNNSNNASRAENVINPSENYEDVISISFDELMQKYEEDKKDRFKQDVKALEEQGAFFVDYEKYTKTGDVSVVYYTNEEIAEKGLITGTSLGDMSMARETHQIIVGDKEKDVLSKTTACETISHPQFGGEYQCLNSALENAILWGLMQDDKPEIKDFCKRFIRPGVDIEKDQRFAKYRQEWQDKMASVEKGRYSETYALNQLTAPHSERSAALGCLNFTKINFRDHTRSDCKGSHLTQEGFVGDVLIRSSIYYNSTYRNLSFPVAAAAFAAYVHAPNASSTNAILKNSKLSEEQKVEAIITKECPKGDKGAPKRKLMHHAYNIIMNKGYPELTCFQRWADITHRDELVTQIEKSLQQVVAKEIGQQKKLPINDKNLEPSIQTDAKKAIAMFELNGRRTL